MSERFKVVVAALAVCSGCTTDEIRGLDEECVECAGGASGGQWVGVGGACSRWRYYDCEEGLYCNLSSQVCKTPATEGEGCHCASPEGCDEGTECADGLVCDEKGAEAQAMRRGQCVVPTPLGGRCDVETACVEGAICNGAAAPDDPRAGTCESPPAGPGAPCAWFGLGEVEVDGLRFQDGIAVHCLSDSLACAPPAGPDPEHAVFSDDPMACCSACDKVPAGCLGHVGTCEAKGVGAPGAPCIVDEGCASGLCKRLEPPVFWGRDDMRLVSPWPGVCGTEAEVQCRQTESQWCDVQTCASTGDCLPGKLCHRSNVQGEGRCAPMMQGAPDDSCGGGNMPGDDRVCAIGLACDVDTLTCRLAGDGQAGASCQTSLECGTGLACFGSACVTFAGAGDSCDGRPCEFALRCARETLKCEVPGTGNQGAPCPTDAACGNKLFCSQGGTCEWLAGGIITACSDPWRPCDNGMTCDMAGGDGTSGICVRD